MGGYLLGYDVGSSSIKATLLSIDSGSSVAAAASPQRELEIQSPRPGWAEQDPEVWRRHLEIATAQLASAGAQLGDEVILTKGPAVETAALLSVLREDELLKDYPSSLVNRAKSLCTQMSVVKDAMTAIQSGGVTAMHDATEGGVIGGLFEVANASQVGLEIEEALFIYPEEVFLLYPFPFFNSLIRFRIYFGYINGSPPEKVTPPPVLS